MRGIGVLIERGLSMIDITGAGMSDGGNASGIDCQPASSCRALLKLPMHDTAMELGRRFFACYLRPEAGVRIVDIGAQDVNGSLRAVAPSACEYVGVDFVAGQGVDIVIDDPYKLPLADASADAVVSSSCFEHSEFFWLLFMEILRVLKPHGVFYLSSPSNGAFHRHPVDCWRFYPDSGVALQNWARRNGVQATLLESFTAGQRSKPWNDFVAVFVKDGAYADRYPQRIQTAYADFTNGFMVGTTSFQQPAEFPQDQQLMLGKRLWRLVQQKGIALFHLLPHQLQRRIRQVLGVRQPGGA